MSKKVITNREFMQKDLLFRNIAAKVTRLFPEIKATLRQASKFRNKRGAFYNYKVYGTIHGKDYGRFNESILETIEKDK